MERRHRCRRREAGRGNGDAQCHVRRSRLCGRSRGRAYLPRHHDDQQHRRDVRRWADALLLLVSSDAGVQRRNADRRDLRYAPVSGLHRQCQFRPRRAERRQQRRSAGQRCVPDRHRAGQTVFRLELSEPDAPLRAQHVPEHDPDVR